jgi:hypothetical protein
MRNSVKYFILHQIFFVVGYEVNNFNFKGMVEFWQYENRSY